MTSLPRLAAGAEFDLIRRFYRRAAEAAPADVRVGPGDDCVVVGEDVVLSTDASVEAVHFRRDWLAPEEIGWRAAAGALSDLAAVAARPVGALVSLLAPRKDVPGYAEAVMDGVCGALEAVGGALLGGDVSLSPHELALDVVAVGRAAKPVLRSGARPGDEVWVTGRLGGAAAAVREWLAGRAPDARARDAFARPWPRIREALWLADQAGPHALIDLSDGLAGDAEHVAVASGVRVVLDEDALPLHPAADPRLALGGGEDYELCLVTPAGVVERLARQFEERFGLPLTRVGEVEAGAGVALRRSDGRIGRLDVTGFRHFAEKE